VRLLGTLAKFAEWDRRVVGVRHGSTAWPWWLIIGVGAVALYCVIAYGVGRHRCAESCAGQGLEILFYSPRLTGAYDGARHPEQCQCRTNRSADKQR
jgi:hypothetical protein